MKRIAIIGSGIAGHTMIKEIRKNSKETALDLYTEENGDYYYKPNLSTALTKQKTPAMLVMKSAHDLCQEFNLNLHPYTHITHCDTQKKLLHCNKISYPYDQLIFATGAKPLVLPPIATQDGPFHPLAVNRLEDYEKFRQQLSNKKRIAIIGAGLVGCEFAHDLATQGYKVDIIAKSFFPLELCLPQAIGNLLAEKLQALGITWHFNDTVIEIDHLSPPHTLHLGSSKTIQADLIISAIGLTPDIKLAKEALIHCEQGIIIDKHGQTSKPHHFALGDCAQYQGQVRLFVQPILPVARAIAQNLFQKENTATIDLPLAPAMVKTPCFPIAALPPPSHLDVTWSIEQIDADFIALAYDKMQILRGYVLTGNLRQAHSKYNERIGTPINKESL